MHNEKSTSLKSMQSSASNAQYVVHGCPLWCELFALKVGIFKVSKQDSLELPVALHCLRL